MRAALFALGLPAVLVASAQAAAPTALPEITITAKSDALTEQRAAVAQKTVLDRAEIEALGGLTVGEVIRKLPGVDAGEHSGDGGMSARSRGMVRDSVQFLVNGERPTANARFALTQVGRMPSGELERIEILRGSSAEFGGAAPLTVNLVMRRPRASAASSVKATVGQRGGEPNAQFSFSRSGGEEGFAWLLPLTVNRHGMPVDQTLMRETRSAGAPALRQQEREDGDYRIDEFILSPRLSWKDGGDTLSLWPNYYRNDGRRASSVVRTADTRVDAERSSTRIARVRLEGEQRSHAGKLSGRAALMDARRGVDRERVVRAVAAPGAVTAWREAERREDGEVSASLRYDRPLGADDAHFAALGVDFARHRRDDRQRFDGAIVADNGFAGSERQWSLWLQDEWRARPDLTLTAGLRGETMRLSANGLVNGGERRHGAIDPSLALRWDAAPGWAVRASSGGAIRFPKLDELTAVASRAVSANSPLEPDRGGNPALRPERIVNFEFGVDRSLSGPGAGKGARSDPGGKTEAGVIGANVYWRRTHDFIERRTALEGPRWTDRPYNEGEARHWGLELSTKLRGETLAQWPVLSMLPKSANLRASLTLPRGAVDDARLGVRLGVRRAVRDMPSHNASLAYEQSLAQRQTSVGFQLQRNGVTRTRISGELAADIRARNLLDAHLVRRLDAAFNLRLSMQNILRADTRRFATAAHGGDAWSLTSSEAGQRSWLLSLEGKW